MHKLTIKDKTNKRINIKNKWVLDLFTTAYFIYHIIWDGRH